MGKPLVSIPAGQFWSTHEKTHTHTVGVDILVGVGVGILVGVGMGITPDTPGCTHTHP